MMASIKLALVASMVFILMPTLVAPKATNVCLESGQDVTNNCIGCICEASTRCNATMGCIHNGALCGPFLISRAFWVDAGQCVQPGDSPSDAQAFVRCATDLKCASRIIRSYIAAFAKDCNGDQLVTCDDYVMLHKNGGWNCGRSLAGSEFWNIYSECKGLVTNNGQNI